MSQLGNLNKPLGWRLKSGERWLILFMGDLSCAVLSVIIAIYLWAQQDYLVSNWFDFINERIPFWFFLLPLLWLIFLTEIYDIRRASRKSETLKGVGIAAITSLSLYLLVFFLSDYKSLPRSGVLIFIIASALLTLGWRFLYIQIFTAPLFMRRVLIVGSGITGKALIQIYNEIWPRPFNLIGLIDDDPQKKDTLIDGFKVIGDCSQMMEIIGKEKITDLVFSISGKMSGDMLREMIAAGETGVEITTMPIIYEELLGRVPIAWLQSDWVLRYLVDQMHVGGIYEIVKRLMDIAGGLIGIIFMVVAFPLIAFAILVDSGFPIFYSQARVGKNGHNYRMYKFRTMFTDAEKDGKPKVTMEHDQRITRVGWLLRKTHIDELPQFFNVLIGDMSLVGPRAERPELMDELQRVIPFYRARLMVRPGLTGWAQVNFGYASNTQTNAIKTEYDLYYIKHRNLMLDLTILLRTPGTVIGFRGQ